jgi:hypothetical protein
LVLCGEKWSSIHGLVDDGGAHTWWLWYGWAAEEERHGKASTLWTAAQTTATIVATSCSRSTLPASRSLPDRVRLRAVGCSWRAVANLAVDNLGGVCSLLFFLCVISGGGRWSQGQSCHFKKILASFDPDIIKYCLRCPIANYIIFVVSISRVSFL